MSEVFDSPSSCFVSIFLVGTVGPQDPEARFPDGFGSWTLFLSLGGRGAIGVMLLFPVSLEVTSSLPVPRGGQHAWL